MGTKKQYIIYNIEILVNYYNLGMSLLNNHFLVNFYATFIPNKLTSRSPSISNNYAPLPNFIYLMVPTPLLPYYY